MTNQLTNNSSPIREEIEGYINMPETGDYAIDCATGRRSAEALLGRIDAEHSTPLLGSVVRGMVQGGQWKPTYAGFFQRIADRCTTIA